MVFITHANQRISTVKQCKTIFEQATQIGFMRDFLIHVIVSLFHYTFDDNYIIIL